MAKGGGFAIRLLHASGSGITEVKQENPLIVYVEKETDTLHIKTEKRIEDVRINDITGKHYLPGNIMTMFIPNE